MSADGDPAVNSAEEVREAEAWFRANPDGLDFWCDATAERHAATIVRAWLARDVPAPAGRDLTAQDVLDAWAAEEPFGMLRRALAERLTESARPSGGVGQPDTAEPRADDGTDLRELRIDVCENCLARKPGTCHVPGCFYIRHTVDEVPTYLDAYAVEAAGSLSPDDAPTTEANPADLLSLDELTAAVENAFDCAAIEVQVWETDTTGARTIESPHPMYRLARCLRSYGLLDERRDRGEDAEDDTTETAEYRVRRGDSAMASGEGDAALAELRRTFREGIAKGDTVIESRTVTPWEEQR